MCLKFLSRAVGVELSEALDELSGLLMYEKFGEPSFPFWRNEKNMKVIQSAVERNILNNHRIRLIITVHVQ